MNITSHQIRYFAHELTRRHPSDSVEKLASVLADAQVDLNPHQVEAALFAFRNPFSKGAILADEVGLGKTIEAGLLLSQKWAEKKHKLLVIVPANLRKQWSQELADKFHLPSVILENKSFNEIIKSGNLNPFQQNSIVLCSYQFVRSKEPYIRKVNWDLVVIDEAHRLRNVYKPSNKIANAIKQAIAPFPKVLLTATPLQNSLLELYGLVSIIDDYAFGDFQSYKAQFSRVGDDATFEDLRERLKPICKRTLRKQVLEYIKYTNRHALVQEFVPSDDEQLLYDLVSGYLQKENLYALPASQRALVTLILRKLLASSTYAISGTLDSLAKRLEAAAKEAESVDTVPVDLSESYEEFDELTDEWEEDENGNVAKEPRRYTAAQLEELKKEMEELRQFKELADSVIKNSKGEVLLTALRKGFAEAGKAQKEQGAATLQQKAVVFTESRRTQEYLFRVLENTEFAGKVMIFNGTNTDVKSKEIYRTWVEKHKGTDNISGSPTADMRAALVDYFREEAAIMIATEAAAEGINLQFCNLVVNYDLPWNPQRIEQRIGRCHRYGQKYDVVVVNFLNKKNAADLRVYELLAEKFRLFDGVFGASDEILGAVESGMDFEKRIATIYQKCRTQEQILFEFNQLQKELEAEIAEGQKDAREKLLNNFDQEVVEKVRVQSNNYLNRFNYHLWLVTCAMLKDFAYFDEQEYKFTLHKNPFEGENINAGPYQMGKVTEATLQPTFDEVVEEDDNDMSKHNHTLHKIPENFNAYRERAHATFLSQYSNDVKLSELFRHIGGRISVYEDSSHSVVARNTALGEAVASLQQVYSRISSLTSKRGETRDGNDKENNFNTYRVGHPLAQRILEQAKNLNTPTSEVMIQYSGRKNKIAILDPLVGKSGWLMCTKFSVHALEEEDHLVLVGLTDNDEVLDAAQIERFFDLPATQGAELDIPANEKTRLTDLEVAQEKIILEALTKRNADWFDIEMDKLEHWADDRRTSLKAELDELDEAIKETRKAARLAPNLPEKLEKQQVLRKLEVKRDESWRNYDAASHEVDKKKDQLLDEISQRLEQNTESTNLFIIHWTLK
jgi:superfamily II DNA/RNA helicase